MHPSVPLEALRISKYKLIVPPMALTDAQVVILYFLLFHSYLQSFTLILLPIEPNDIEAYHSHQILDR